MQVDAARARAGCGRRPRPRAHGPSSDQNCASRSSKSLSQRMRRPFRSAESCPHSMPTLATSSRPTNLSLTKQQQTALNEGMSRCTGAETERGPALAELTAAALAGSTACGLGAAWPSASSRLRFCCASSAAWPSPAGPSQPGPPRPTRSSPACWPGPDAPGRLARARLAGGVARRDPGGGRGGLGGSPIGSRPPCCARARPS